MAREGGGEGRFEFGFRVMSCAELVQAWIFRGGEGRAWCLEFLTQSDKARFPSLVAKGKTLADS